jgi:hypothetical protein
MSLSFLLFIESAETSAVTNYVNEKTLKENLILSKYGKHIIHDRVEIAIA